MFPTRAQFYATVLKQFFVFPDSIIYYISKNPISPKCYQKIVQTCKYFFIQSPILIVHLCYSDSEGNISVDREPFDLKNICTSKLWITQSFETWSNKNLSLVISKLYRFDGKAMKLCNQTISYDELLLLSSNVESLVSFKVCVRNDNGSIVSLEKIIEAFPKIKKIIYYDPSYSPSILTETVKELLKIPQFLTLNYCKLGWIPEDFDIESFYIYIKKNKHTKFYLHFSNGISEDYKNRLEEVIDEILEDEYRDYKPPCISFLGLHQEKQEKLNSIYYR